MNAHKSDAEHNKTEQENWRHLISVRNAEGRIITQMHISAVMTIKMTIMRGVSFHMHFVFKSLFSSDNWCEGSP